MMYASTSVDRRAEYYARCAEVIASDPLDFYTRAERGRRYQAGRLGLDCGANNRFVVRYLSDVARRSAVPAKAEGNVLPFRGLAKAVLQ